MGRHILFRKIRSTNMKKNNAGKSAAIIALMSLLQVATANAEGQSFIPLENLPPDQRQQISQKINELSKELNIDWDEIIIGVNENGQISFRNKNDVNMQVTGSFSCLSGAKTEDCKK